MFKLATLLLLRLFTIDPDGIHVFTDVSYTNGSNYKQQLDLYVPGSTGFPTIIFVHGGSLISGDRKGFPGTEPYREIGSNFARLGIGMVVLSYRLGPENKWPTMAQDVAAAVGWTKRRIAKYGGDSTQIYLAGHSSGGHIASVVATNGAYLNGAGQSLKGLAGCIVLGSSLHPSYDIEGRDPDELAQVWERANKVGGYESVFPSPQDYRDADPCFHVNKDVPKFLVIFGDDEAERTPALEHADQFAGLLDDVGVRSDVEVVENRTHMGLLQRMTEEGDPTVLLIKRFVKKR